MLFAPMSDPQPSSFNLEKVQRLDVGRFVDDKLKV